MAQHILANSKEGVYTYEQLMMMSAKQLKPIFAVSLCAEYAEHVAEVQEKYKHGYPCGGIVPETQFKLDVNTGDAVIKLDEAKNENPEFTGHHALISAANSKPIYIVETDETAQMIFRAQELLKEDAE
jgi:hypothetical protein